MTHKKLFEEAIKAADRLNNDPSVSVHKTADSLADLRDHVDMLIEAIADSMVNDEGS